VRRAADDICGGGVVFIRSISYAWRLVFTGVAFAAMGLGGTILALTLFPPVAWLTRDPVLRQRRVQGLVRGSFRFYLALLEAFGLISLRVVDADRLKDLKGKLIVANHPTLLDVVILMMLTPRAQCIVKHQLWRNIFLRWAVVGAGYIRNDLEPGALVASCIESLRAGNNLIVFPEGTRTKPGQPIRFRRGFANIATLARSDVQAVLIACDPPTLAKGEPWYRIPPRRPQFTVTIGDLVSVNAFLGAPYRSLAARRLLSSLERRYADALNNGKSGTRDQTVDRYGVEARGLVA
jgi:1-acyl-sn-glycerol-3-phosphate acyltransferase